MININTLYIICLVPYNRFHDQVSWENVTYCASIGESLNSDCAPGAHPGEYFLCPDEEFSFLAVEGHVHVHWYQFLI